MIRAGVFIGVDKTGNLQKLNDAAKGACRMHEWALAQGMSEADAKLITDEGGQKVSLDIICTAIEEIVNGAGVDQLIVYFAGHGVYHNYSERWLLSAAPQRTSEAINVLGSVELARQCGIRHVVFISDACRMAAADIQALNVLGSEIFPNEDLGRTYVDQFFACSRGKAAIEYKDSTIAASTYTGLFTSTLLDALNGTRPEVLEPAKVANDPWQYITPPKLDNYLRSELPRRVRALKLQNKMSQDPDAIVIVGGSWIARINQPVVSKSSLPLETGQSNLITRLTKSAINGELVTLNHDFFDKANKEETRIEKTIQRGVLEKIAERQKNETLYEYAAWQKYIQKELPADEASTHEDQWQEIIKRLHAIQEELLTDEASTYEDQWQEIISLQTKMVYARSQEIPRLKLSQPVARMLQARMLEAQLDSLEVFRLKASREDVPAETSEILEMTEMLTLQFGPDHFETKCGVKVQGTRITGIFAPGIYCELVKKNGGGLSIDTDNFSDLPEWGNNDTFRVHTFGDKLGAINILLRFEGGFGTVISAIPGFIVSLTFDKEELVNVAYEPSANTKLWKKFNRRADSIRILRAVAATSSRHGRFSLDPTDALQIAKSMQYEKSIDPTLSIYAAYAYYDLQEVDRIQRMARYQQDDLRFTFFDLALLGRQLTGMYVDPHAGEGTNLNLTQSMDIAPFVPLLSQGWALLRANRVQLHPALADLENNLLNSLWSLYDGDGVEKLKQAMQ